MKKFIEFFFGYGSSIVFVGVAYWLLYIQPNFDAGIVPLRITYVILFFFLFSQAILVQLMRGQDENKGMVDVMLSVLTIVALVFLPFISNTSEINIWWDIYIIFASGTLYDFLMNNRMILRQFRMSTGFANEE